MLGLSGLTQTALAAIPTNGTPPVPPPVPASTFQGGGYQTVFQIDTAVQIEATFFDVANGVYADPTIAHLYLMDPAGNVTHYQSTSGAIQKTSTGRYVFAFLPEQSGVWTYKWQGTGTVVATSPDSFFTIPASELIAG